jgi:hypothetical protein
MNTRTRLGIGMLVVACAVALPGVSRGAKPDEVIVVNPVTLNPASPNPVTLSPNASNPVTIVNPASAPVPVGVTNAVKTINQDEPARHPYHQVAFANCQFAGDCATLFAAVPAGVRRVINHLSCSAFIPDGPGTFISGSGFLSVAGEAVDVFPVALTKFDSGAPIVQATASVMTLAYVEAGQSPQVHMASSGAAFGQLLCVLSGHDVSLP